MRSATAAVVLIVAAIPPVGLAASAKPHLRIVAMAPLSLHGAGFIAGERVSLRVTLGQTTVTRLVTTTAAGSFTSVFTKLERRRCKPLRVEAVGAQGDRAAFTLECPDGATT